jgi:hypothetical protein
MAFPTAVYRKELRLISAMMGVPSRKDEAQARFDALIAPMKPAQKNAMKDTITEMLDASGK